MRLLITLLVLLLSGCWEGRDLYAPVDSRVALAPGTYRVTNSDGSSGTAKVSILSSGMTAIEADGDALAWGFAPLDREGRSFVHWYTDVSAEASDFNQSYYLIERQSDQSFVFYAPSCDGEDARVASAAGAVVIPGLIKTCRFKDRISVENAMRALRPSDRQRVTTLVRIGEL